MITMYSLVVSETVKTLLQLNSKEQMRRRFLLRKPVLTKPQQRELEILNHRNTLISLNEFIKFKK
jgi:hypothetical protein